MFVVNKYVLHFERLNSSMVYFTFTLRLQCTIFEAECTGLIVVNKQVSLGTI